MKRRLFYGALFIVLACNLIIGAQIYFSSVQAAEKNDVYPNLKLFSIVLDRVRSDYVDGGKLSYQELIYGALKGMINTLDPHSEFMEPVKYDDLKKDTQGEFGGVGIVVSMKDNYLTVVAPMEDTPGFKAGILSGDRIVKIDGRSAEKFSLPDAVKRLRGEPGSDVTVTILRPSNGQIKDYKLTRAQIKVDTVKDIEGHRDFPLSENKVGYVRLMQFGEQTGSDLEDALRKLEAKGMEALILDLRGNPGGLLDQAVKVCEKWLPRNQLVVSTEGRDAKQKSEYHATGRDKHQNLPMVILVNNGSASASEIVAGCLQDTTAMGLTKAIIVGEQTFGKGSVQSILPLQDGSALRLTTAKYYTPSHKVIHEKGITPDIIVPMSEEEDRDVAIKRTPGALESLDAATQERIRSAHDPQLDRALDLLKGIALYSKRAPAPEKRKRDSVRGEKVAVK
ncbi:MAG TPA: S41 family peptidase [Candidatus Saccharimonadales bacterium]|nr:S41 family peptidase [Candidatus Saccharimonadales bacterium]